MVPDAVPVVSRFFLCLLPLERGGGSSLSRASYLSDGLQLVDIASLGDAYRALFPLQGCWIMLPGAPPPGPADSGGCPFLAAVLVRWRWGRRRLGPRSCRG